MDLIKIEYENTDITIEELCQKHNKDIKDLAWYLPPEDVTPAALDTDLLIVKRLSLTQCKEALEKKDVSIKDIKDIVSTIKTIEDSLIPQKDRPASTQILIQNFINGQEDDC